MKRIMATGLATALLLVAGCTPLGSPKANPDHGPPQPPNGRIENPDRPQNIPGDFLFFSWHIITLNDNWEEIHAPVTVFIEAASEVPGQSVHGGYPFQVYTYTAYTHTIWYQPGLTLTTRVTATLDPPQPGVSVVCIGSSDETIEEQIQEIPPIHDQAFCSATWVSGQQ